MTAEAVLNASKDAAIQALMVDPVVTTAAQLPQFVDHMIAEQSPWLDYLG
jgi:alpha-galactosidase